MPTLAEMMTTHARAGRIVWIGVRTARRGAVEPCDRAAIGETGLLGDHRTRPGPRAVTIMQAEHVPVIAALAGPDARVTPEALRRNVHVRATNVLAYRDAVFQLGSAVLRGTGICAPCSRMTEALGQGGYNAVRGHGGITAEVVEPGEIALGSPMRLVGGE